MVLCGTEKEESQEPTEEASGKLRLKEKYFVEIICFQAGSYQKTVSSQGELRRKDLV